MKKGLIILCFALILFCFSACKGDVTDKDDIINVTMDMSLNKYGVVQVKDGMVWFGDFESGIATVLCSKPNCSHVPYSRLENPKPYCNAAIPGGGYQASAMIYNDWLYLFVPKAETVDNTVLYRSEMDGSNREKIATIPYLTDSHHLIAYHNKVYMTAAILETEDEEDYTPTQRVFLIQIDLTDGSCQKLMEPAMRYSEYIAVEQICGEELFYTKTYFDDSYIDRDEDFVKDLNEGKIEAKYEIWSYSLTEGTNTLVIDNDMLRDKYWIGIDEQYHYFKSSENWKKQIIVCDRDTMQMKTLWEGEARGSAQLCGEWFLVWLENYKGGVNYLVIHKDSGEVKKLQRPGEKPGVSGNYNGLFLVRTEESFAVIRLEDFMAGKTNYLVEIPYN